MSLETKKALALLAYLAAKQGTHTRDSLIALLWPEANDDRGRARLRRALWAINKEVPDCFQATRQTVAFDPAGPLAVDSHHFQQLYRKGSKDGTIQNPETLRQAVALYRGEFMQGFLIDAAPEFEQWQIFQAHRWERKVIDLLHSLSDYESQNRRQRKSIRHLNRLLAIDPMNETAHRKLIRAYAALGESAAALKQYEHCRAVLKESLGIEPDEQTIQLYNRLNTRQLTESAPTAARRDGTGDGEPPIPNSFPSPPTPLIGRQKELDWLLERLSAPYSRILTVVGPGGIGKTRLAIAAGERCLQDLFKWPDGVFFVSLASISDSEQVPLEIEKALPFNLYGAGEQSPAEKLLNYLAGKKMLLILDNYEQLLPDVSFMIDVVDKTENMLLVTSRESLQLRGEERLLLSGLEHRQQGKTLENGQETESVSLFKQAAQRNAPNFQIAEQWEAIEEICQLVNGMPLAIELAASLVDVFPVEEILNELREDIALLAVNWPDVPQRHQSIHALFESSWRHLSPREQEILVRLSLCPAGFTKEAAEQIAEASTFDLAGLVRKSMIQFDRKRKRYVIHELLRQFLTIKLDERADSIAAARHQFVSYFLALLIHWEGQLKSKYQIATLKKMDVEMSNCLLAWEIAVEESEVEFIAKTVYPLAYYFLWRGQYERGRTVMAHGCECAPISDSTTLTLKCWMARFSHAMGDPPDTARLSAWANHQEESPTRTHAFLLSTLGIVTPAAEKCLHLFSQSRAMFQRLDYGWEATGVLEELARILYFLGKNDEASQAYRRALQENRAWEDPRYHTSIMRRLTSVLAYSGQLSEARRLCRQCLASAKALDELNILVEAKTIYAVVLTWCGEFAKAHTQLFEVTARYEDLGRKRSENWAKVMIGLIKSILGEYEEADNILRNALRLNEETVYLYGQCTALNYLGNNLIALEQFDEAISVLQRGLALKNQMDQINKKGWSLSSLATAYIKLGKLERAYPLIINTLKFGVEQPNLASQWFGLLAVGLLWVAEAEQSDSQDDVLVRVAEIYGLLWKYAFISKHVRIQKVYGQPFQEAMEKIPAEISHRARARGEQTDITAYCKEVISIIGDVPQSG